MTLVFIIEYGEAARQMALSFITTYSLCDVAAIAEEVLGDYSFQT